jgi:ligand-binding SRPBCC domain-containing protein
MADYVLESRIWIGRCREDVFTFFADPANLAHITPPSLHFRVLTPSVRMEAGAVLDYELRWLGLPLRWRTLIREWDPPYRFVDVQIRGPYARWEHRHRFLEENDETWVEDRVTYQLPFGPLGHLAHTALVRAQLAKIWDYRRRRLASFLGPVRFADS